MKGGETCCKVRWGWAEVMPIDWMSVGGEVLKMVAQLGGALVIARLAVTWALGRHKSEKIFERTILAVADLQSSLLKMQRAARLLYREAINEIELPTAYGRDLGDTWNVEERKFQEAAAVAMLFLPDDAAEVIGDLRKALHGAPEQDWAMLWEGRLVATESAVEYFEDNGRRLLRGKQ